ncbi:unnamed protein product, partial [Timema podura]|nr:unnamed protein product [Timema podura]
CSNLSDLYPFSLLKPHPNPSGLGALPNKECYHHQQQNSWTAEETERCTWPKRMGILEYGMAASLGKRLVAVKFLLHDASEKENVSRSKTRYTPDQQTPELQLALSSDQGINLAQGVQLNSRKAEYPVYTLPVPKVQTWRQTEL